jgi:hypothetical protein
MCQLMHNSTEKLSKDTTIIQQRDTLGSFKHLTQLRNITSGQDFKSLSRTMSKDVEHVNNSKLTEIHQSEHSCL